MKEEDKLLKKVGTGNPFTTPEGYFEQLTSEVMNKLPEQEAPRFVMKKVTLWDRVKPWTYMAAMFVGAALIIKVASYNPNPFEDKQIAVTETVVAADSEVVYDGYIDYAVNQSMMDDYSLYVYLTDASVD
ncbi:hypothetical protein [Bacteroides sp. 51]|uniref:hypothetical protein n=1 Tax=Bacteroides sp. 51 TaxID=2302938 RepID=UPI0013D75F53|nr:hypothetical protein [Bacteroides sp. 51]NDV82374.1 hypothetical protein [Bacteroides sp. 51]